MSWLKLLVVDEAAQDLVEYGLLAAFISLAVIASIEVMGTALNTAYGSFKTQIDAFSGS